MLSILLFEAGLGEPAGFVDGIGIPPHEPTALQGLHAYASPSIHAGEVIEFHVSSSQDYTFSLVRLGEDAHSHKADEVLLSEAGNAVPYPIYQGSYLHFGEVDFELQAEWGISIWVRPFRVKGEKQVVASYWRADVASGWELSIEGEQLVFYTRSGESGNDGAYQQSLGRVDNRVWQHLLLGYSDGKLRFWKDGKALTAEGLPILTNPMGEGAAQFRVGAGSRDGLAGEFYDGDLASLTVFSQSPSDQAAKKLFASKGLQQVDSLEVKAFWDFSEEAGEWVFDQSKGGINARIINRATWMIGGPSFDAAKVQRLDRSYHPSQDPQRGHGLRLAADDLYDCRWPVAHAVTVPKDSKSGLYCGRFEHTKDGVDYQYNVTFCVRPAKDAKKAPILVLASAKTWYAYNVFPFADNLPPGRHDWGRGGLEKRHANHAPAAYCFYKDHSAGQPAYQVGTRVPIPAADPYRTYRGDDLWGQWVMNERLAHLWLDKHGYEYDLVLDIDIDAEPELLEERAAVMILGHSEYWTDKAYEAIDQYLSAGGDLLVMSANTMFWRAEIDHQAGVIECRKLGTGMLGSAWTQPGEIYHGEGLKRGGLKRFGDKPAWSLVGLETAGWCAGMDFLPYTVDAPEHFLFNQPNQTGLEKGAKFGYFNGVGMVGHEYDVRPSILVKATKEMPVGFENVEDPAGITVLASCYSDRKIIDFRGLENLASDNPSGVISEIIYWERPQGGRVFNVGTVAGPWGLYYDSKVSKLVANVLHHFGAASR